MKKMMIVAAVMATLVGMGYNNQMQDRLAAQEQKIQQLTASNEAYYEGLQVQKSEAERLERVNEHYASIMTAR